MGSCTMKYNPKINEEMAGLEGFANIHPLQPENTVQGCLEALHLAEEYLNKITGMDAISFQPAAGAHGEYTGLKLIKAYHDDRGDFKRDKIIVPDSAHGTNPASAAMLGYKIINIKSSEDGFVDLAELEKAVGMTLLVSCSQIKYSWSFDPNILKITEIVRKREASTITTVQTLMQLWVGQDPAIWDLMLCTLTCTRPSQHPTAAEVLVRVLLDVKGS